jgi:glycerol-3-phosphate acyltransferase PlsY
MTSGGWLLAVMMVLGYGVGSLPFGIIVSRALGVPDPRTGGSRNIGFTNVLRVAGRKAGVLTLLGDAGKGWAVGWVAAQTLDPEWPIFLVAGSAVVGHMYSIFLGLEGGKGVATALGALMGIAPMIGLGTVGLWGAGLAISRISSVGALVAFLGLPLLAMVAGGSQAFLEFVIALSGLVLWRHRENIERLVKGQEPRMGHRRV